jgi:lipopolysaccharide transport system ATP-binding protein
MDKNIAISVQNLSKTFRIPHEKVSSLRGAFVGAFRKKTYEKFQALDKVSFEVKKGEFFGIIGRNGSGKSTLLKILAGIYQPDRGKVRVNGLISPFLELGIGFNPELTGRDNIYLNATVLGLTKKQIDQKFNDIVAFSELERFIDQKLKNYSSGMQVRLAFSVAIHANREILLMDEVLAVGDSNFQGKCLTEFNRYKSLGKTVILVTHDITTTQRYCDRVMLLRNGKIMKIGNAEEVCNAYIYENMDDEEKRLRETEKQSLIPAKKNQKNPEGNGSETKSNAVAEEIKQDREIKNKSVKITGVEFFDKNGKIKNVFETGESLDIKISFKIDKDITELNFGIGLHLPFGGQIFGYNTQMDKYEIKNHKNFIILHLEKIPILKGEYIMNVACWGDIEQNHYDYKPRYKKLIVHSTGKRNNYRGCLDIDHEWRLQ